MFKPSHTRFSAFRPAALRTPPRAAASTPSRRKMVSTAALSLEEAESSSTLDLGILDIFDAPSRLGESSKLLVLNAAVNRQARALYTHAASQRPVVKPLPAPIILDGPARPRSMSYISFRASRAHLAGVVSGASRSVPASLPPPILFDGPSRLRPYTRSSAWPWGSSSAASSYAMSATPFILAVGIAAVLFGVDFAPETRADGFQHRPSSHS